MAFVVTRMDLDADAEVSSIWIVDDAGPRPFTTGRDDTSPRWSPDGSQLAFLRSTGEADAKTQLALTAVAFGSTSGAVLIATSGPSLP